MKLTIGMAAAIASCAAAAQQPAEVYTFPSNADSASTPSISPSVARLILLQRLAPAGKGPSVADLPEGSNVDEVADLISKFGGESASLFGDDQLSTPSQLVVMLEGLTDEQMKEASKSFSTKPAFAIADPPSSGAHDKLIKNDFYNVGITNDHKCSVKEVTNPFEERCWSGRATVAKYNVKKHPKVIADLASQTKNLVALAKSGEMQTTVVLLPASGVANKWSDKTQELRRRQFQAEQVISATEKPAESSAPTSPSDEDKVIKVPARGSIPACFTSEESCATSTGNCSGHGNCQNRYAKPDGSEGKEVCYVCSCLSTKPNKGSESVTHWAGPTCAKKDVSVPFWLFFGFTIVMVGVLATSIGLLFSVGEEKLPGVIGAGVSKPNK